MTKPGIVPPVFAYRQRQTLADFSRSRIMPNGEPYSFDLCPYFLPVCSALDDVSHVCRVVLTTCAQSGKSTLMENFVGLNAVQNPRDMLIIFDTSNNARTFSTTRLRPFLQNHCKLKVFNQLGAGADREARSKSATQISLGAGSTIMLGGSRSAADLCSRSVPVLCLDEVARFATLTEEGDSISLALRRTVRFRSSMTFISSTPTVETGSITSYFKIGTQEIWMCECSGCHELFDVEYKTIDFSNDTPTTHCPHCGEVYSEADIRALPHRFSLPMNATPYHDRYGRVCRSFAIHAELGSFYTWDDLWNEERAALKVGESSVRSFTNTVLGRVYTPETEQRFEPEQFDGKLLSYDLQTVPSWVRTVVGGADTQDDMLVLEMVGFSEDGARCTGLGIRRLVGDTSLPEVWRQITEYVLNWTCRTEDGRVLKPRLVCVDSGGHRTQTVYALSAVAPIFRAVKGSNHELERRDQASSILERMTTKVTYIGSTKTRVALVHINTIYAKSLILSNVRKLVYSDDAPNEPWVWSDDPVLGYTSPQYWEELASSNIAIQTERGLRFALAQGAHDESLDCRVYALAAFELYRQFSGKIPSVQAIIENGRAEDKADEVLNVLSEVPLEAETKPRQDKTISNIPIEPPTEPRSSTTSETATVRKKRHFKPL